MYSSIVVGTDGSVTAQEAVRRGATLAALTGAQLTVVTAYRPAPVAAVLAAGAAGVILDVRDVEDQQRLEAEEMLMHAVMRVDAGTSAVATKARAGNPAEVVLAVADEVAADLIVVGNRGLAGASRFLLGSVPNRIAHHAGCAVLIVHTCP